MSRGALQAAAPALGRSTAEGLLGRLVEGAALTSGVTLLGRLISFLATVVLARTLAPADFGLLNMALLALLIVDIVTERGLPRAVVQSQADFRRVTDTGFMLLPLSALVIGGAVAAAAPIVASLFDAPAVAPVLVVLAAAYVLRATGRIGAAVLEKRLAFRRRAVPELLDPLAQAVVSITLAVASEGRLGIWALVWGFLAASAVWSLSALLLAGWRPHRQFDRRIARDLLLFTRDVVGVALLVVLVRNIDNFAVGRFLGPEQLGLYALAFSLSQLPNTILSNSLSRVLFPAFARLQNDPDALRQLHRQISKLVAVVIFPLAAFVAVIAPDFIPTVYGPRWLGSVVPLQILALNGLFSALLVLNQTLLTATGRRKRAYPGAVAIVVLVLTLLGPALGAGIVGVAALFTGASLVGLVISETIVARALGNGVRAQVSPALRPALALVPPVLALLLVGRGPGGPLGLAGQIAMAALMGAAYLGTLLLVDREVLRAGRQVRRWRPAGGRPPAPVAAGAVLEAP